MFSSVDDASQDLARCSSYLSAAKGSPSWTVLFLILVNLNDLISNLLYCRT